MVRPHWLERLLAQDRDPTRERVRAQCVCAYLANGPSGTFETIDRMLDEADLLAHDLGDPVGGVHMVQQRGLAMRWRGEHQRAIEMLRWAADERRPLDDLGSAASDLALLSAAASAAGAHGDVFAVLDECLALCEAVGESWIRANALWAVGVEHCKVGDLAGAAAAQWQSLELRIPLDVHFLVALNLDALAWVAVEEGDCQRAARLFGAAEAVRRHSRRAHFARHDGADP